MHHKHSPMNAYRERERERERERDLESLSTVLHVDPVVTMVPERFNPLIELRVCHMTLT